MVTPEPFPPRFHYLETNTHPLKEQQWRSKFAAILFSSTETFIENWEEQLLQEEILSF